MKDHIVQHFYTPTKTQMEQSAYITWAGHRKCGKDHVVGPRVLETYKMVFVLSGKGYLTQGDHVNKMLNQGDIFILLPGKSIFIMPTRKTRGKSCGSPSTASIFPTI
ncbi:AraC family ligand binding domain-containing protein [Paenibacillus sonchi]|uniref:AraC family ligand binding domain-containing protein n=1 Tax=Paenibacillus sonchi TaxID=373687 RepID=A0A974P7Z5_9BACL|nr:AraC family ligand binding domain-containing protein [Paenibacillus sonchi]QQZ59025.1 AraC family ligand binding domain-containing protein [Paenibacillus sonchi]